LSAARAAPGFHNAMNCSIGTSPFLATTLKSNGGLDGKSQTC
jgi:hypothetical protein